MIREIELEIEKKYQVSYVRVVHRIDIWMSVKQPLLRLRMQPIAVKLFRHVRKRSNG